MNNNPLLGQVLGGLFGQAMARRGMRGGMTGGGMGQAGPMGGAGGMGGMGGLGGLGGVAIGSVLAGMMRGRRGPMGAPGGLGGNQAALLMMLLPLAMRWVQRNGGMGAVLDRFRQRGYDRQAQSWVSTGANQPLDERAVEQVVGQDELRQMAQSLGVPEQQVAQAFADIMPEMVDRLTPEGQLPQQADEVLEEGRQVLEQEIHDVEERERAAH